MTSVPQKKSPISVPTPVATSRRFDYGTIRAVWEKAKRQPGFETFSLDSFGAVINRFDYGKKSEYGWVIAYVVPPSKGGSEDLSNLRPIHWKNLPDASEDEPQTRAHHT